LSEWIAFDADNPIGQWRADYRMARVCQAVAASVGADQSMEDLMPKWGDSDEQGPAPGLAEKIRNIARGHDRDSGSKD
jgi:hypothetical protein